MAAWRNQRAATRAVQTPGGLTHPRSAGACVCRARFAHFATFARRPRGAVSTPGANAQTAQSATVRQPALVPCDSGLFATRGATIRGMADARFGMAGHNRTEVRARWLIGSPHWRRLARLVAACAAQKRCQSAMDRFQAMALPRGDPCICD
jgi:hypothetical protein